MQADLNWLDDPEVFRVNQLPAHSDHYFYTDSNEIGHQSSLVKSLNGNWRFRFSKSPQDRPENFYQPNFDSSTFDDIKVPGHIELAGYGQIQYINTWYPWEGKIFRRPAYTLNSDRIIPGTFSQAKDNTVGSYLKKFTLPESFQNKRVVVQFQGVETAFYVWLNGEFVGYAEDSFTPSEFNLTDKLVSGENILAVEVFKRSTASYLEDQDMFRFSGIFRDVNLLGLPEVHVEDLDLKPVVNDDFKSGKLDVSLELTGKDLSGATAELSIIDPNDDVITTKSMAAGETTTFDTIDFSKVDLWSPDTPTLYYIAVTIKGQNGQTLEVVPYQFGFRKVELQNDKVIYVNNKRLIINGVNRHEWSATRGRAITLDDMKADIKTMQANNINADRTCHYPDQIPWYYLCDQNGIYLMAENNLESHGTWQKMGTVEPSVNVPGDNPHWLKAVLDRARSNYHLFKNHVSIIFWSLGNESFAGSDIAEMNKYYKQHDQTRLTHYEGVFHKPELKDQISDVESRMYEQPENIEKYLQNDPKKPFLDCEYMHDMGNSIGGMNSYNDLIDKYPMYQGGFIWDFIDQALLVHDNISGRDVLRYGGDFDERHSDYEFSGDGLMFADRTEKPAMQEVKYYYGQHK